MTRKEPRVWNSHDVNIPDGGVYVGRPSRWGNPFRVWSDGTRDEVIAKYERWLLGQPELVAAVKAELRGRDLVCWCKPLRCHADVLLHIANREGE